MSTARPTMSVMFHQLVAAVLFAGSLVPAGTATLPLGDADLAESRSTRTLARGVTLTEIVRGTEPAPPGEINTTTRGPWRIEVLTIDQAINLDGGGSTTMSVRGAQPSGGGERPVGDALVWTN